MRKTQALVTAVTRPAVAHIEGTYQVTVIIPMRTGYATEDGGETWIRYKRRVAKPIKKQVFTNYQPVIGAWIEVNLL